MLWNIWNFLQAQKGFLKLGLQCIFEYTENDKFIICKTSVENTSRRPIYLVHAFLLIVDQSVSYEDGIDLVIKEIISKVHYESRKRIIDETENIYKRHKVIFEYLESHDHLLEGFSFIIKLLPYYYVTQIKLGSLARMSTTHIQKKDNGIYSVYFVVIGKDWYKRKNSSQGRVVHDEVIVK